MSEATLPVVVGDEVRLAKTLTETDIALFAAVSGDFDPIHMDERYARGSVFGRRIAHGVLTMALLSGAAARMSASARERGFTGTALSLGYDRVRFTHPVGIGDSLEACYLVEVLEPQKQRSIARVTITNETGTTCIVGQHLMKWQMP